MREPIAQQIWDGYGAAPCSAVSSGWGKKGWSAHIPSAKVLNGAKALMRLLEKLSGELRPRERSQSRPPLGQRRGGSGGGRPSLLHWEKRQNGKVSAERKALGSLRDAWSDLNMSGEPSWSLIVEIKVSTLTRSQFISQHLEFLSRMVLRSGVILVNWICFIFASWEFLS